MKIGLVYDLRSDYLKEGFSETQVAEFDADITIESLERTLGELGHVAERIGHARALCKRLLDGDRWDLVFTIAEGVEGRSREAQVPAILELFGQPYTFSDPLVCAVTLDKAVTKRLLQAAGIATPRFCLVSTPEELAAVDLTYPLFAKPVAEGTGKGVDHQSRIHTPAELQATILRLLHTFTQPVLVEEYLPGREFTTGLLGTGRAARVVGTMEFSIRPGAPAADYSLEVKEQCEKYVDYFPMPAGPLRAEVEALALATHRVLECRDAGRVDIRLDAQGRPQVMEHNPLPGLNPGHSDLPMLAAQEGMSYADLIKAIVTSATERRQAYPRASQWSGKR